MVLNNIVSGYRTENAVVNDHVVTPSKTGIASIALLQNAANALISVSSTVQKISALHAYVVTGADFSGKLHFLKNGFAEKLHTNLCF